MYSIGIDIGGTSVKAGILTDSGNILRKKSDVTDTTNPEKFTEGLAVLVQELLSEEKISFSQVKGVGVGSPGSIDSQNGVVLSASNLGLNNFPLRAKLEELLPVPVWVENDANCAALGEYRALNDASIESFVMITLGTGVGGGIILNGKIYTGYNGAAGEFGHMMIYADGERCPCGRRGCWEVYASARALSKFAQEAAEVQPESMLHRIATEENREIDGRIFFRALRAHDAAAQTVFARYLKYLGVGLINVIWALQPQVIVLGGGISNEGEALLLPLKQYLTENSSWGSKEKHSEIRTAILGNDAGILGAAFLVE